MSLQCLRFGFFTFFALSALVAANLLILQPSTNPKNIDRTNWRGQATLETSAVTQTRSETGMKKVRVGSPNHPVVLNGSKTRSRGIEISPDTMDARVRFLPANAGNSVELVRAIQRELAVKGYAPGAEDGVPGTVTRAAILAFQYDNRLPLTAEPTEELLQHLVLGRSGQDPAASPRASAISAAARDIVIETQRQLKRHKLWSHPIDGHFDRALSRAIQTFETQQRLPITGRVSGRLISRLRRLAV